MGKVDMSVRMVVFIMENGYLIINMEKVLNNGQMVHTLQVTMFRVRKRVTVSIDGLMLPNIVGTGRKI